MNHETNGQTIQSTSVFEKPIAHFIDSLPAMVAGIDCNMVVKIANKPFGSWCNSNEVLGKKLPVLIGRACFFQVQRFLGTVLAGRPVHVSVMDDRTPDIKYIDVNITPELNDVGLVEGFIFHAIDVTYRHTEERTLKDFFENASIGLHWVNAHGKIIWANPAELRMLGYAQDEYIGHHISEFHVERSVINDILDRLAAKETIANCEAQLRCKDGSVKQVSISSSVLWDGDRFIHTRCFTIDITEQKRIAQAINESDKRFKLMANLVPLIIWTSDAAGDFQYLNIQWTTRTGFQSEEGYANRWLEAIHPDDKQKIEKSWTKSVSQRKPFETKFRLVGSNNDYTIHFAHAVPRFSTDGIFIGHVGILQDISSQEQIKASLESIVLERTEDLRRKNAELKRAEDSLHYKNRELERINSELSSFAHVASHDLQEPLRKIQTYTARITEVDGAQLSEKGRIYVNNIQNSSERMRNLIRALLSYSKTNEGVATSELTDLNEVLEEVMGELEIKIESMKAVIENHGLPTVRVVRFQFYQLFLNLISNALKFSKESTSPRIEIRSSKLSADVLPDGFAKNSDHYCLIQVTDNGIGFDQEQNLKIFEIFQRLHGRNVEGTGIGLSICKKIIENHNGALMAEGKVDHGATFSIYLPLAKESALVNQS